MNVPYIYEIRGKYFTAKYRAEEYRIYLYLTFSAIHSINQYKLNEDWK